MKNNNLWEHIVWSITILLIIVIVCNTLLKLKDNPLVIKFEMDNNTLEAAKSINYTAINNIKDKEGFFVTPCNGCFGYIPDYCLDYCVNRTVTKCPENTMLGLAVALYGYYLAMRIISKLYGIEMWKAFIVWMAPLAMVMAIILGGVFVTV